VIEGSSPYDPRNNDAIGKRIQGHRPAKSNPEKCACIFPKENVAASSDSRI
jgi:hypothetical protein